MPGSLFGSDGVVGEVFGEALDDETFRSLVRLRDEIDLIAFVGNVQRTGQFFDEGFAGFLGNFDGGFEVVLGHGRNWWFSEVSVCAVRDGVLYFTTSGKASLLVERWTLGGTRTPVETERVCNELIPKELTGCRCGKERVR